MAAAAGDGIFAGGGVIFERFARVGCAHAANVGKIYGVQSNREG